MSDTNDFYSRYLDGGRDGTPETTHAGLAAGRSFSQEATPSAPASAEVSLVPKPGHRDDSEPAGARDVGRRIPGGLPPQASSGPTPASDGASFRGEPQQSAPPPDDPPSSDTETAATHTGQQPGLHGRYSSGLGDEAQQHLGRQVNDGVHDASVGALRAQIRESAVAPPYRPIPQMGWRKGLYRVTHINLGLSQDERDWNDLERRLTVDLRGNYVIAVMGAKGGDTDHLGGQFYRPPDK